MYNWNKKWWIFKYIDHDRTMHNHVKYVTRVARWYIFHDNAWLVRTISIIIIITLQQHFVYMQSDYYVFWQYTILPLLIRIMSVWLTAFVARRLWHEYGILYRNVQATRMLVSVDRYSVPDRHLTRVDNTQITE